MAGRVRWALKRFLAGPLIAILALAATSAPLAAAAKPTGSGLAPALTAGPGQMAEAALAVDPADPDHLAVAADPYRGIIHIEVTESHDGGHTWSPPVSVLPPGAAKSYDPTPLFLSDGRLVVVGGASSAGRPFCQPGSSVFVASLDERDLSIDVLQPARRGVYVDRPTATADATSDTVVLSWTESVGAGAECRGVPSSAKIVVRQWGEEATCRAARPLVSSGSPSAFGAGLARAGQTVVAAARELGPGPRSRLTVSSSVDGGCTFGDPQVIDEGPQPPSDPAVTGGFAVGVPSVALGADGSVTAAWSVATSRGVGTRLLRRSGITPTIGFRALEAPADAAATELLPTLAADRAGGVWQATAAASPGGVAFLVRRWEGTWAPTVTLATGSAGRYTELGEGLGLAASGPVLAAAAPVDGPGTSRLVVGTQPVPELPEPPEAVKPTTEPATTTAQPRPAAVDPPVVRTPPRSRSGSAWARAALVAGTAAGALATAGALVVAARRRRSPAPP